ncbi:hypothetical protein LZ554_000064 [Drepanopeziza brunnea f. sp. 'monogermtubi']|nr:hypothetical protein LZ554_000064 [Drepanopeziza brunnea f. sp. 'monogermtubi']
METSGMEPEVGLEPTTLGQTAGAGERELEKQVKENFRCGPYYQNKSGTKRKRGLYQISRNFYHYRFMDFYFEGERIYAIIS